MSAILTEVDCDEVTSVSKVPSNHVRQDSLTNTAIHDTITRPGAVRINVKGAFIVDEGTVTPHVSDQDGAVHETSDIRLPHHTSVVSHVAIDV